MDVTIGRAVHDRPSNASRRVLALMTTLVLALAGLLGASPARAQAAATSGMTLAQAQGWISTYKAEGLSWNVHNAGCAGGALANCVAVSQYFVNRYTTVPDWANTTHGKGVAAKLASTYGWPTGSEPRAYSVLSTTGPDTRYGHTAVVLGVNADGSFQIAEADCFQPLSWAKARTVTLAGLRASYGSVSFVYPPQDRLVGLASAVSHSTVAATNADGRIQVFASGLDKQVHTAWQTSPNAGFSGWGPMGFSGRASSRPLTRTGESSSSQSD